MNEELRKLLADARAALGRPNVTLEQVDAILQADKGVTFAQLEGMENQERIDAVIAPEPPKKPSQLFGERPGRFSTIGRALTPSNRAEVQQEVTQPMGDIVRMLGRGVTGGGLEEIGALPGLFSGTFGERRQKGEAETRAARERLGTARSLIPEVVGGFTGPGFGLAKLAAKAPTFLARVGVGALGGAGIGAVSGAAEAENLADLPGSTAIGAGLGAGIGTVIPAGVGGAGALFRTIRGVAFPKAAALAAAKKAVRDANLTPDQAERIFLGLKRQIPGEPILADIDPKFGALLRDVVADGGPRAEDLLNMLEARTLRSGQRLGARARELAGIEGGPIAATKKVKKRMQAQANALYDELEEVLVPVNTPAMQNILRDPEIAKIWKAIRPRKGKPVSVTAAGGPIPFRHIQQLRRRISGEAKAAWQSGNGALGDDLTQAKIALDDVLEGLPEIGPRFRAANRAYATNSRTLEAFGAGAKDAKPRVSVEESLERITNLAQRAGPQSAATRQAYKHGMVDQMIRDRLTGQSRAAGAGQRVRELEFTDLGEKIRAVFPDEGEFRRLIELGIAERRLSGTALAAVGKSVDAQELLTLLRGARQALVQGPGAAAIEAVQQASTKAVLKARADAIADILLGRTPQDLAQLLEILGHRALPAISPAVAAGVTNPAVRKLLETFSVEERIRSGRR